MGIGHDLAESARDAARWDRLKRAAVSVLDEYDAMRDQLLLGGKMSELRAAVLDLAPPPAVETVVWDIDPKKHFARVGGRVVATATERPDGTWGLVTDDGREWPAFRSAEAARKAFEDSRRPASLSRAGTGQGWKWWHWPNDSALFVDGLAVGTASQTGIGRWMITKSNGVMLGYAFTRDEAQLLLLLECGLIDQAQLRQFRADAELRAKAVGR